MGNFGSRLKALRTESGLTQKQLADQIGLSKSVISFYERNERCPSPEILIKLASVFHVSSDYLLEIERTPTVDISGLSPKDEALVRSLIESLREKNKTS